MKITCNLRGIIAERGIKHGWLAEKTGISQTTMSALINNRQLPTLPVAYKISKELNLIVEDIWKEDE